MPRKSKRAQATRKEAKPNDVKTSPPPLRRSKRSIHTSKQETTDEKKPSEQSNMIGGEVNEDENEEPPQKRRKKTAAMSSMKDEDVTPNGKPSKKSNTAASKPETAKVPRKQADKEIANKNEEPPQKRQKKSATTSTTEHESKNPKSKSSTTATKSSSLNGDQGSTRPYWLMKAEPDSRLEKGIDVKFSIDDLQACTEPEPWEGVRNHVAKNNMIAMKKGDLAFFYHSNTKVPGIAGIMEIVEESSVDKSALDPKHPYYDPKSDPENPRWFNVHVGFKRKFPELITLKELQAYKGPGEALGDMQLLKMSRLSVSRVSAGEWEFIMGLAGRMEDGDAAT